ncbi:hypothetical protein QZH41_018292 [Actinostola sp. cb2023]|nr:hypothetical protein QZH41_018292 [Actinostola sp. cb2023]
MLGASHAKKKNSHILMDEFALWNKTLDQDEICRIVRIKTDIVFNITLNFTDEMWTPSLANPSSEAFKSLKYSIQNSVIPASAPKNVSGFNTSSTSVLLSWDPIDDKYTNGNITNYRIVYKQSHGASRVSRDTLRHPKTDITVPNQQNYLVTDLKKFTNYTFRVAAVNERGIGLDSRPVIISTDEDVPSKPPPKLSAHNTSSTNILVQWQPIPSQYVHGVLEGYNISYHVTAKSSTHEWNDVELRGISTSVKLDGLEKFTEYAVQVRGFTIKGEGMISKAVRVWTGEDVPDAFPVNVTGFNESSTELYLEWQPLKDKQWNGRPVGYKIFYSPRKTYHKQTLTVSENTTFVTLEKLYKYTWYTIQMAAFTSKGLGPKSPDVQLQTSEDVPSKSSIEVKAKHTSHTSLLVEWKSIPKDSIHGILLGFRIQYWVASNHKEEQMQKTEPEARRLEIKDALIYTKYAIRILGFTSAGDGEKSDIIYATTDEYIPGAPPENLRALNKTSPTKIKVYWEPIKKPYNVHGVLRGYKLFYKPVSVSNETIKEPQSYVEKVLKAKQTSVELQGLSAFTRYHVYVLAFTIKGNGVATQIIVAETCNCHNMLYTNWWPSPPYVEDPSSTNHSGIVPPVLEDAVRTCCEDCAEFEATKVNYAKTANGKPAKKKGLQEFKENIDVAELSFPVYGFMDQKVYSGSYGFAPLVKSPGIAMIIIGDEEGAAAKMLIRSIILCWPIVFLDLMLLWVLSIVIWFAETFSNSRHFPHNMLQGTWEGMWWAFSSMTTLGYGDRIPKTHLGRIICIVWILIGVILIACFNSTMTSVLTARILDKDIMLYGTKIAAIQNSSEYRFGVRKNARVNPNGKKYSNLDEIYTAMTNRDVRGILIDAYTAGSRTELFNRTDIRINKLYDYSSAYGVVLGGESKKLQKCFHRYLGEQRSFISNIIEKNTQTIKESSKAVSVERSQGLFDPKFPTYLKAVISCSSVLVLLYLIGAKFQCAKKIGWITFNSSGKSKKYTESPTQLSIQAKKRLREEMSFIVEAFFMNCQHTIAILRYKHLKELQLLARLRKENDYEPVQKGSITKNNLWSVKCKKNGNVFSSSLFKNSEHRNGQPNGFSFSKRFKKSKEVETVV